jgi:mitotic spindle assembly checkpoint protein MAD2B
MLRARLKMRQGNVDKVVVVIKDKDEVGLERFIFTVQNMIEVEAFNKDTDVDGAMAPSALGQYFRSFLVKLNMLESQLGELPHDGTHSFAILIELHDGKAPSVPAAKVSRCLRHGAPRAQPT